MLRLADLLSEEPFGLELLSGGPDAAAREVRGAHAVEDLDVAAAVASSHVHRNSLRNRLARAEQMLGCSLKRPATIAAIHIALVAEAP